MKNLSLRRSQVTLPPNVTQLISGSLGLKFRCVCPGSQAVKSVSSRIKANLGLPRNVSPFIKHVRFEEL